MSIEMDSAGDVGKEKPAQRTGRGRPRDTEKNASIVAAARALFLDHGYEGTSMDEVAKSAGVSKQTVYSHFSSKEHLFRAAVHRAIADAAPENAVKRVETHSLEADLTAVCEEYTRLLLSAEAIAVNNLVIAASAQGKAIPTIFWESGVREIQDNLEAFLQGWINSGDLTIAELDVAVEQIISLLKGKQHFMLSIGMQDTVTEEDIQKNVTNTVAAFLKLYRT